MSKTHKKKHIEGQNELILLSLDSFYSNQSNIDTVLDILENNKISLRIIDWFVTNYSKKNNIEYSLKKTSPKINIRKKTSKLSKKEEKKKKF